MSPSLSADQREKIRSHVARFQEYMKGEQFKRDEQDRLDRVNYFQRELPSRLPSLSEADVDELVRKLWSSRFWGNKEYLVQLIIAKNGLDHLRQELTHLLDVKIPVMERYARFSHEVDRLGGPASLTEMLAYLHPDRCGIWNGKVREALALLGLESLVDVNKYQLSAGEYEAFNQVLELLAAELRSHGLPDVDLLFTDFFLYEVVEAGERPASVPSTRRPPGPAVPHDEIRDRLQGIGLNLGFQADVEVKVAHGAVVDCVWRARIGNLGLVTYCFEVQVGGSIDGLLLNLQRAKSGPTVQKVIAVSDDAQLEKIRREVEGLPEEFRKALGYWPIAEVVSVSEQLASVMDIIGRIGLVQGQV